MFLILYPNTIFKSPIFWVELFNGSLKLLSVRKFFLVFFSIEKKIPMQLNYLKFLGIRVLCFPYICFYSHSAVILREYFKNIPLKSCNIARIFIKLLERFLKYCRNLATSAQNIINVMLLQY